MQSPSFNTLSPDIDESVDFDNTKNLFIEAENLEALKILQKSYAGKVKMIYIDPPYNTGKDSFIYPDKFTESKKEYAKRIGDTDENDYLIRDGLFEGAWRKNSKDHGHFHSNWLSMMLPRLHLAKTLLREDGVIFISIDDNEQAQLKLLCDEVFGEENFVGSIGWESKTKTQNTKDAFNKLQPKIEYILVYGKKTKMRFNLQLVGKKEYSLNDEKGVYRLHKLETMNSGGIRGRETMVFPILGINPPNGKQWKLGIETITEFQNRDDILLIDNQIHIKMRPEDERQDITEPFWAFIDKNSGTAETAKKELNKITENHGFETVKPVSIISKLVHHSTDKNSLILDFFAGSGTTAHAVMQLNAEDGGNRRFICIQLPEKTDKQSEAAKAGFATIADIAKARIRRAGSHISGSLKEGQTVDTGFKVFKLSESHFKQWQNPLSGSLNAEQQLLLLEDFQDVVKENVSQKDLAYELMLRLGFELTDEIEFQDSIVWLNNAEQTRKTALLLDKVNQDVLDRVLEKSPKKVFALDKVFEGNDSLKTNMAFQLQNANIDFETL